MVWEATVQIWRRTNHSFVVYTIYGLSTWLIRGNEHLAYDHAIESQHLLSEVLIQMCD